MAKNVSSSFFNYRNAHHLIWTLEQNIKNDQ